MLIDAGTEFDTVIGGEPYHIIVRRVDLSAYANRQVFDSALAGEFEVTGPTSIELDVSMVVIPLGREDQRDITEWNVLGIEGGKT